MMISCYKYYRLLIVVVLISFLIVGCGGIPTNHPDLVRARNAFDDAKSKTWVSENAPVRKIVVKILID